VMQIQEALRGGILKAFIQDRGCPFKDRIRQEVRSVSRSEERGGNAGTETEIVIAMAQT